MDVSASSRDKRSYRCSLCNENITGVDNSEKHLYSVSHQEVFKKNVNPDWELQIPLKSSSSYFHVLMDLWGVCKDKYKTVSPSPATPLSPKPVSLIMVQHGGTGSRR
ncbi:unnamed protein product [Trichobilharzia regenti]|nr:unnamed protein product [Trichobilharzia regenti]